MIFTIAYCSHKRETNPKSTLNLLEVRQKRTIPLIGKPELLVPPLADIGRLIRLSARDHLFRVDIRTRRSNHAQQVFLSDPMESPTTLNLSPILQS